MTGEVTCAPKWDPLNFAKNPIFINLLAVQMGGVGYGSLQEVRAADAHPVAVDDTWTAADDTPTRADLFLVLKAMREAEADANAREHAQSFAFKKNFVFPDES